MLKKIFVTLFIILTASVATTSLSPNLAFGEGADCREFLPGMVSWDCNTGLTSGEQIDEDKLKSAISQIIVNITNDVFVIVGYIALGFVIYGGYLYVFSNGDPNKTATATKTLSRAFIGLAIVGAAEIIMGSIGTALGVSFNEETNCVTTNCINPNEALLNAISWIIGITGIVSAIFVVYGGIMYITSSGDAGKLQKAKKTILFSLIGLIVVALSEVMVNFVIKDLVTAATSGTEDDISVVIAGILKTIISIAGIVAVVYILIGGTQYITALGDPGKIQKARTTILYACIGLIVCALAFVIVNWTIGVTDKATSYLEPVISKFLS